MTIILGKFFFKYRGQIPVFVLVLAFPILYFSNHIQNLILDLNLNILSLFLVLFGCTFRYLTIGFSYPNTSGRNRDSQVAERLNKYSLYSITRNPLYLSNMLIWTGIVIRSNNLLYIIICLVTMISMYNIIINHEEFFLKNKFKNEFISWKKNTPRLIPNFFIYKKSNIKFNYKSLLRREYAGLLAILICIAYIDSLKIYISSSSLVISNNLFYLIIVLTIISLILKYLRKNTTILDD